MAHEEVELTKLGIELLKALSGLAVQKEGWTRRGVRGWAFTDELPSRAETIETLRRLAIRGLALREDVDDPFRVQPWCIHRITQVGQNILADAIGLPYVRVDPPSADLTEVERETIYVSMTSWCGLEFLAAQQTGCWCYRDGIQRAIGGSLAIEEGTYLVARGLVERDKPADRTRARPPRGVRATAIGRAARLLDRSVSECRVQVHVPGFIAAAGPAPPPLPARVRRCSGERGRASSTSGG